MTPKPRKNDGVTVESYAVKQRRASSKEEHHEQQKLAGMLPLYLDASRTFWTALENKPRSAISGMFQKRRGVRSGIPDLLVIFRKRPGRLLVVFVELKSRRGMPTPNQEQVRCELLPVGVQWWMARSANAALMALHLAGVEFRRQWKPPTLKPWEGPFKDPTQRLPMAPDVIAERQAARRRWRERQKATRRAQPAAAEAA